MRTAPHMAVLSHEYTDSYRLWMLEYPACASLLFVTHELISHSTQQLTILFTILFESSHSCGFSISVYPVSSGSSLSFWGSSIVSGFTFGNCSAKSYREIVVESNGKSVRQQKKDKKYAISSNVLFVLFPLVAVLKRTFGTLQPFHTA